ncbi:MAG TPA: DMT family transporter [bacterium]|nr:DMT family transporter [bacterium]
MPIGRDLLASILGLASAASWGAGDFVGGLTARRAHVLGVVVVSQCAGVLFLIALALVRAEPLPAIATLSWAGAAGLSGGVGLTALYRALAVGQMGVAAPITAVVAAALPVLYGSLSAGIPDTPRLVGFALAIAGIWRISRGSERTERPDGIGPAMLAGVGFGGFYILIHQVGAPAVFWPLAAAKITPVALMSTTALLGRRPWVPTISLIPLLALAGGLDVGGNVFFVLASQTGRLDVSAILSSLYPATTLLLARGILKERITRSQATGMAAVLIAIPLIAA